MQSWPQPTERQVDGAVAKLIQASHIRYFFEKLSNPEWLAPLLKRGFFKNPPPPIRDEGGDSVSFPVWPESQYLARVARHKPEAVYDLIVRLSETENVRVIEDLIEATLALPPALAVRLTPQVCVWAKNPYQLFVYEGLGKLIVYLARHGYLPEGLRIAAVLLQIIPPPKTVAAASEEENRTSSREPTSRLHPPEYESTLTKSISPLVELDGKRVLRFLADLLEAAVKAAHKTSPSEDYSYIWRTTIIEGTDDYRSGLIHHLIDAVRDAARQISETSEGDARDVFKSLNARPLPIFKRLAIYVVTITKFNVCDLIQEVLANRQNFDNYRLLSEFSELLATKFDQLEERHKAEYFAWINNGPDLEKFQRFFEASHGRVPAEAEKERRTRIWKRDHIARFGRRIPKELVALYEELVATEGEAEDPTQVHAVKSWHGPTSPLSIEKALEYSVDDLITHVKNWVPSGAWDAPSKEGLARTLQEVVSNRATEYSAAAENFIGVASEYATAFLRGCGEGLKAERKLDWTSLLLFCDWAISQVDEAENPDDFDAHPWRWSRTEVARILEEAFKRDVLPKDLADAVFPILERLAEDSDPIAEEPGSGSMDPVTLSINSTRGCALHALFSYALWRVRALKAPQNLDAVPEMKKIFDDHLNPEIERHLSIHSIYGQFFPWITVVDRGWAEANVDRIFPVEEKCIGRWNAAWSAYIRFCSPYDDLLQILGRKYEYAIQLERSDPTSVSKGDLSGLASHLMNFYWRAKLDTGVGAQVLKVLFDVGSHRLWADALNFIGRNLMSTGVTVSAEAAARLSAIWDRRLAQLVDQKRVSDGIEIGEIGWWVASNAFDFGWSLRNLNFALDHAGNLSRVREVVQWLEKNVDSDPQKVASTFDKLVKRFAPKAYLGIWRDPAKELLVKLARNRIADVRSKAIETADFLGALGYMDFDVVKEIGP